MIMYRIKETLKGFFLAAAMTVVFLVFSAMVVASMIYVVQYLDK